LEGEKRRYAEIFLGGKKVKAEKNGFMETPGSCARKTRVAEQNRGSNKNY
jgi:hypothetical protein